MALAASCASAGAAAPIEGVWSFNGGEVAIQAAEDGTFTGTVVAPTKFTQCYHPVGEKVWSSMQAQPDGSYWGNHQWYFATEQCVPNPTPGLTAWRVLTAPDGTRLLRVCFSEPESSSQPTIDSSGVGGGSTFGCQDSARISALPGKADVDFPHSGGCRAARKLRVRLREAKGDPFKSISVVLRSGLIKRKAKLRKRRHGVVIATLSLVNLPSDSFTVRVRGKTVLGKTIRRSRRYSICAVRPPHRGRHAHHHQG
jgi:hypothetical protein